MKKDPIDAKVARLFESIHRAYPDLTFRIIEAGAVPLGGKVEVFYHLLDFFPGSQILAFELDPELCSKLNESAPQGLIYHSQGLGRTEERRKLYETNHGMCTSLYEPNHELIDLYHNLEVARLKCVSEVDTVSLDHFIRSNGYGKVDFIKIDIQGAELEVFQGGVETLRDVLLIVTEVEFVPIYKHQPLFGDVSAFLAAQGLMYNKILGVAGRSLKPVVLNNNPNAPMQHLWSDAVFLRSPLEFAGMGSEELLKLAVLALFYGSTDITYSCLAHHDARQGTAFARMLFG